MTGRNKGMASLHNLAGLYTHQGRYGEAEPLYRRALAIREKALGPDHPDVAQHLNSLAGLYHEQGVYDEAEPLAEGMGRGEAMQAVQLEMLHSGEQAHPKDWAVVIVSGDDTPMVFPAGQEPRGTDDEPPQTHARGGCATRPSGHSAPAGSMLIGLLGFMGPWRRGR